MRMWEEENIVIGILIFIRDIWLYLQKIGPDGFDVKTKNISTIDMILFIFLITTTIFLFIWFLREKEIIFQLMQSLSIYNSNHTQQCNG